MPINPDQISQNSKFDLLEDCTNATDALAVNDAVYLSGNGVAAKADATDKTKAAMGIVAEVVDSTNCKVQVFGTLVGFSTGMTAGAKYYLSTTAGALTTVVLGAKANRRQYVGYAWNTTDLFVDIRSEDFDFHPLLLPNCTLLLDGAGTIYSGAAALSAWIDQSGNGWDFTQATGANQPLHVNGGGLGGHPYLTFDGADDFLDSSAVTSDLTGGDLVDWTAVAVFDNWSVGGASFIVNILGNAYWNPLGVFDTGDGRVGCRMWDGASRVDYLVTGVGGPIIQITTHEAGGTLRSSANGAPGGSPDTGVGAVTLDQAVDLGFVAGGAGYFTGDLYEVATFSTAMFAAQEAALLAHYKDKYGIA